MNHKKNKNHRSRITQKFDAHSASAPTRMVGAEIGRGKGWRCFGHRHYAMSPVEHFRAVARTPALPSKHVRTVEETARAARGRNF